MFLLAFEPKASNCEHLRLHLLRNHPERMIIKNNLTCKLINFIEISDDFHIKIPSVIKNKSHLPKLLQIVIYFECIRVR